MQKTYRKIPIDNVSRYCSYNGRAAEINKKYKIIIKIITINLLIINILITFSSNAWAAITPSVIIKNTKVETVYIFIGIDGIMENTWQDACKAIGLPPTDLPGGEFCITKVGNAAYVQSGDLCADGSIKFPRNRGWCENVIEVCPNSSWSFTDTLTAFSQDKKNCYRSDEKCWKDLDNVSEVQLLAAIVYGESHWSDVYEEMAGIASAVIRKRDAGHFKSVNDLVKRFKNFSYVVYNKNDRFTKVMCNDPNKFKKAYDAAQNALQYGKDYSNGGCYWDGYDLKTSGTKHPKYKARFKYSDPSHNIFSTPEPPIHQIKGSKGTYYTTKYISTSTQGRTIFWKLDETYLDAQGGKQCS